MTKPSVIKQTAIMPSPLPVDCGSREFPLCSPLYSPRHQSPPRLDVVVLFTGFDPTLRALQTAAALARDLNARIRLVVPEVVPYPLPIDTPPALPEFSERRFEALAARATASVAEMRVEIYLCRDRGQALTQALEPASTVVIAARKPWWPWWPCSLSWLSWPSWERRVASKLRRAGHQVIFSPKASPGARKGEPAYA